MGLRADIGSAHLLATQFHCCPLKISPDICALLGWNMYPIEEYPSDIKSAYTKDERDGCVTGRKPCADLDGLGGQANHKSDYKNEEEILRKAIWFRDRLH